MMLKITRVVLAFWLMAVAGSASASWDQAAAVVEDATRDVLTVLEDEALKEDERFAELVGEMDRVLTPVIDFDYVSKRVMGKYYRRASSEQREQFSDVFKTTLLKTYVKALVGFDITSYELRKPAKASPKPEKQVVPVVVKSSSGVEYTVLYYMLKKGDQWRLVNASMDGINLRLTFKNQFANMAQEERGKVGQVISVWQQKVDIKTGESN